MPARKGTILSSGRHYERYAVSHLVLLFIIANSDSACLGTSDIHCRAATRFAPSRPTTRECRVSLTQFSV
jgi:hypothetical protein